MPKQRRFGSTEKHHFFSGSYLILGFFFVFYQIFSSIFPLPLLIGFFFNYMFVLLHESEQTLYELDFRWYFSLFYLVFIDITHDFYLFSSCFAFFAFYYFCADWIRINFTIGRILPILFCVCAYVLLFVINNVLSYIDTSDFKLFGGEYLVDMLVESALCYLIFRKAVK